MNTLCDDIRALHGALYDGELPEELQREVMDHLAVCEPCRIEYRQLQSALGALARLGDESLPAAFEQRVLARVRARRARLVSVPRRQLAAAAVILVAFSTLVGVLLGSFSGEEPASPPGVSTSQGTGPGEQPVVPPTVPPTVPPAGPTETDLAVLVEECLAELGLIHVGERWLSPLEAQLRAEAGLAWFEGEVRSEEDVRRELREQLEATLPPPPEPVVVQQALPPSREEVEAQALALLQKWGFVELDGQWRSPLEARLLQEGLAFLDGAPLSRARLRELLQEEVLLAAGMVRNPDGNWVNPDFTGPGDAQLGHSIISPRSIFELPPEAAAAGAEDVTAQVARRIRDLGQEGKAEAAEKDLRVEGPHIVGALQEAYASAREGSKERLVVARLLAWYGVETSEMEAVVRRMVELYEQAGDGKERRRHYLAFAVELQRIGRMGGRYLERHFVERPTLRRAELLDLYPHAEAEAFLLRAYLGRPGAPPEARADLHEDFLAWWLHRPASGDPANLDLALAMLHPADERVQLVGVHLLERIGYLHPRWAGVITEELLQGAASCYCSCSMVPHDKGILTQFHGCRLHEVVPVSAVPTAILWQDAESALIRNKTRTTRGSVVAADMGRVLTNLTGQEYRLSFRGERSGDQRMLRENHIATISNWMLRHRQHRSEYEARWAQMEPILAQQQEREARAPWHLRNRLALARTDPRGNVREPELGWAGIAYVKSDRKSLGGVKQRFLGPMDPRSPPVAELRWSDNLPRKLQTGYEFHALGTSVLDGLTLALAPRGLILGFDDQGLYLEPWRGR